MKRGDARASPLSFCRVIDDRMLLDAALTHLAQGARISWRLSCQTWMTAGSAEMIITATTMARKYRSSCSLGMMDMSGLAVTTGTGYEPYC